MKKLFSVLLAVLMLAALCGIASAETGIGIEPGETMPDFTATLTDGTTVTLSELLKEKDLVVLNLFASFCKPCEKEFPEMEKIYQANRDRMEIVALSAYSEDTMEVIADYKESHALSFPMGLTGEDLSFLEISGYPTTIMIDHNGKVGLVKVGAFVGEGEFEEKVNYFLSADYSGESLSFEKAVSFTQYIIYALVFVTVNTLALAIGRWGMLRKAGKRLAQPDPVPECMERIRALLGRLDRPGCRSQLDSILCPGLFRCTHGCPLRPAAAQLCHRHSGRLQTRKSLWSG